MIRRAGIKRLCGHWENVIIICRRKNYLYELDHAQYSKCRKCDKKENDFMSVREFIIIMAIGCILASIMPLISF